MKGLRLSDLLDHLSVDPDALPDNLLVELLGGIVRSVAALHQAPGQPRHGALNPSRVVITPEGSIVLLECGLADSIEKLQRNREQLWREFGLAMPPSASLPRFDRRTDVTQLAAIVLALVLRRPLGAEEYPRGIGDLIVEATSRGDAALGSALRMWLQQAMQLHARANFATAADAEQALAQLPAATGSRRAAGQAIRALVRLVCDEQPDGILLAFPVLHPAFPKLQAS